MDTAFWIALLGIVWVDLLLSGDNAVVIALVCRQLPEKQQKVGMVLGSAAAVGLRVVLSFFVATLMTIPGLSALGGAFLLYVAAKMVLASEDEAGSHKGSATLLGAVATIAIADAGMSLDNVMAIAGLSHGNLTLMALGVLISIPLVVGGSALISMIIGRMPILATAGAALLGWVAGGIVATDAYVKGYLSFLTEDNLHYGASFIGCALVLAIAGLVQMYNRRKEALA